eukprot:scaffold25006_cov122-Amphora_coffeaeformis.AAC.1
MGLQQWSWWTREWARLSGAVAKRRKVFREGLHSLKQHKMVVFVLASTMVRVNPYGSSKQKLGTILDSFWTTPTLHLLDW